ncbi:hypothetical protein AX774_g8197 [Zancudomyces culisetae]|uniref:Uncharacterized protein n=1 Tax=Zancudomyces culisetae TaxID=1213189 RepID=A0A1R1PBQ9_ZANCU|nr:hypothetical protein AX774_g8197 [Zancudomyces culisetae]|eukprot:OMH78415.1 hypothetical protein AX774_g8197 [Zancudomyces culisetae]
MATVPASEYADMFPEVRYVVERPSTYDLKLYPELRHAITSMDKDFFKSQLSETDRRTFYASCPRNEGMEYTPPSLPDMGQSQSARRQDAALYDLQYKLSGITRPIDNFIHQCIQGDGAVSRKDAVDFANISEIWSVMWHLPSPNSGLITCSDQWEFREAPLS